MKDASTERERERERERETETETERDRETERERERMANGVPQLPSIRVFILPRSIVHTNHVTLASGSWPIRWRPVALYRA